jgi:transposase InsO family protein
MNEIRHHERPLGPAQWPARQAERHLRKRVLAFVKCSGRPQAAIADLLQLAPQTVSQWQRSWCSERLPGQLLGRPRQPMDPAREYEVKAVVEDHGRALGVPALKGLFRDVPRAVLRDIRREVCRQSPPAQLCWTRPGAVWSTDFTAPDQPLDGVFGHILLIRDLASGFTLCALPCLAESAELVASCLVNLFRQYGPPLVLKTDNGGPFQAAAVTVLLAHWRVENLCSPVYTPEYNGSVEATGGCMKARLAELVLRQGAGGWWSSDHLEGARQAANQWNRPWGVTGPTPHERWHQRRRLCGLERFDFVQKVTWLRGRIAEHLAAQRRARGLPPVPTQSVHERSTVDRLSIRQALVALGYLEIRRPAHLSTQSTVALSEN